MTAAILSGPTPETPVFRDAPHNLEAEQALLGAILVNNEAVDRVSSFLKPDHFFDQLHGRIFEATAKLIMGGKRATPITLKTFFQNVVSWNNCNGLGHVVILRRESK
jgi:replicative DNA helicase